MKLKNILGALAIAVAAAALFAIPRIGGIDTWKILLAIAGLAVFRYGDRLSKRNQA